MDDSLTLEENQEFEKLNELLNRRRLEEAKQEPQILPPPVSSEIMNALIETASREYLKGFAENRRRAIVAEAQRKRARCCSIPFYAKKEMKDGPLLWLGLAISYQGED